MGGPYFEKKDLKGWGIPKGRIESGEEILDAAIREFEEETSIETKGPFNYLGSVIYQNGKTVHAFAFRGKFPGSIKSNTFLVEWPPKSGNFQEYPENDRGDMFTIEESMKKVMVSQEDFIRKMEKFFKNKNLI